MKIISEIKNAVIIAALVMGVVSCSDDDPTTIVKPTLNITATAATDTDLTSLVLALKATNLLETLNGAGPFTVLAPTNAAFASFLKNNGFDNLDAVPKDVLKQTLLNHVIKGNLTDASFKGEAGYKNTLATFGDTENALSLYYNKKSGLKFNGVSTVSVKNIAASNGTIHKVDAVISLPTVITFAAANPDFSSLTAAVTGADLVPTLSAANGKGESEIKAPFTVFAPTNAAFQALLDSNDDWKVLTDVPTATVAAALQLHVIAELNVTSSNIPKSAKTLGGEITFDGLVINGPSNKSKIISTVVDIQAANGIIHAINQVLLPAAAAK